MSNHTIVLIEDDREIASTLTNVLEAAGHTVHHASNGIDGQKLISGKNPELVITDMMMPRMGGFPVLEFLKQMDDPPKVIMITANEGGRHKAYAEMLGVVEYLRKPFAMDLFLDAVSRALDGDDKKSAGKGKTAGDPPIKRRKTTRKKSS